MTSPAVVLRRVKRAALAQVHAHYRTQPLAPRTVFYESFGGNGMLCNPEAIFRSLLQASDQQQLKHIWALSSGREHDATIAKFAGNPRVSFVRRGTTGYYRALATSRFLVNNATFPPEFSKRPGQIYLNTWHGTPLKHMGFDMPDGPMEAANTLRNFVAADYLLSQNPFMTETMYGSAYKLDGLYRGTVIEAGYPRVDLQFLDSDAAASGRHLLDDAGITLGGRRLVVFAPTWRGASFNRPDENLDEILEARSALQQSLDPTRWFVALKLHQAAHAQAAGRADARGVLIPNAIPTNTVLGIAEILVTDYSSIFFDFLATGRPIVFFTPDHDDYADARGLYQDPSRLPGPVCVTIDHAAAAVATFADATSADTSTADADDRYAEARRAYVPWDDGHAAERVIDIVFRGTNAGHRLRRFDSTSRPTVLLHLGGMRPNGITTAAFNLVNSIDQMRFDVSVLYPAGPLARHILTDRPLDAGIRHFARVGGMNGSKWLHAKRRLADRLGRTSLDLSDPAEYALWDDEWTRCFGDSEFDHVIDFSGYGPIWARLLLHSPTGSRTIWLHNDMAADAQRRVNGKLVHARSLKVVFSHYNDFDALVSVSPALAAINRRNLGEWAAAEKFISAPNCVDGEQIRALGASASFGCADEPEQDLEERFEQLRESGDTLFITVGRLSTEKNQARLISAFALVHARQSASHLVIVGSGPLRASLEALIEELGLTASVTLTGELSNPYAAMSRAHCFVLSSDYEGQPMVLLEAAVLGLAIISVDFETVADALPPGTALIVPQTVEALAEGMAAYLAGAVSAARFDDEAHNREAIDAFYRVLDVERRVQEH
ncbi:glycosyltransferase [Leifsonia psychrotolerans]|uniref:glycosyltransferase n=1 Tax=Glaciibacter psychrotolerans TaxID=670054 RepID=UPI0031B62737